MKNRLDKEMVNRGMVDSRMKAQELIAKGYVLLQNQVVNKASYPVTPEDAIEIQANDCFRYVSRGGLKLEKALSTFAISWQGKTVLDVGSSTGGFTDCALQHGAQKVIAVDVGTDLMHPSLRANPKVELHEQINLKELDASYFERADWMVADISFLSILTLFEKVQASQAKLDTVFLIKPQFECGKEVAHRYKGIITNAKIHQEILNHVLGEIRAMGFAIGGLTYSPICGGDGNIEYLAYGSNQKQIAKPISIAEIVTQAFQNLKQKK